jgi:hypothetical protein
VAVADILEPSNRETVRMIDDLDGQVLAVICNMT